MSDEIRASLAEAEEFARRTWDGIYRVVRHRDDTDGVIWKVTLHASDGPVHFVKNNMIFCHASHGCHDAANTRELRAGTRISKVDGRSIDVTEIVVSGRVIGAVCQDGRGYVFGHTEEDGEIISTLDYCMPLHGRDEMILRVLRLAGFPV